MKSALRWSAAVAYAAGIFVLSGIPNLAPPGAEIPGADKAAHLSLYFFFAALLWWAFRGSNVRYAAALAVIVAALYGATDEVHQHFVEGRTMSFFDWLADLAGASLWPVWLRFRARRTTPQPRRPGP